MEVRRPVVTSDWMKNRKVLESRWNGEGCGSLVPFEWR